MELIIPQTSPLKKSSPLTKKLAGLPRIIQIKRVKKLTSFTYSKHTVARNLTGNQQFSERKENGSYANYFSTFVSEVTPVPHRLALAPDRFYIHYGGWHAGIQLTRLEAYRAIELVGSSRDSETIWWAIEAAIAGGAS